MLARPLDQTKGQLGSDSRRWIAQRDNQSMILAAAAVSSRPADTTAPCPKCAATMVLAAITPHPIITHMERHTFLCAKCNQTKTYMLQSNRAA